MPIPVQCQCGKRLAAKDQFAGKTLKCPQCGSAIKVPMAAAASSPLSNPMDELFDQEGFGKNIAAVCPSCSAEMAANAVLCTQCGYNKTTGEKMVGHRTPGVDVDMGTLALEKAEADMHAAKKLQKDMTDGSGMPWWMLGLILFILISATSLAVMSVMSFNRTTGDDSFNPMKTFLQLSGVACALVSVGAFIKLVAQGFRESQKEGLLCLTILYLLVFTFKKPKGRIGALLVMLVLGGTAAALLIRSQTA
ncbi:MAG: hypothetical protein AAFV88_04610 [Planctomycetota bacterium]